MPKFHNQNSSIPLHKSSFYPPPTQHPFFQSQNFPSCPPYLHPHPHHLPSQPRQHPHRHPSQPHQPSFPQTPNNNSFTRLSQFFYDLQQSFVLLSNFSFQLHSSSPSYRRKSKKPTSRSKNWRLQRESIGTKSSEVNNEYNSSIFEAEEMKESLKPAWARLAPSQRLEELQPEEVRSDRSEAQGSARVTLPAAARKRGLLDFVGKSLPPRPADIRLHLQQPSNCFDHSSRSSIEPRATKAKQQGDAEVNTNDDLTTPAEASRQKLLNCVDQSLQPVPGPAYIPLHLQKPFNRFNKSMRPSLDSQDRQNQSGFIATQPASISLGPNLTVEEQKSNTDQSRQKSSNEKQDETREESTSPASYNRSLSNYLDRLPPVLMPSYIPPHMQRASQQVSVSRPASKGEFNKENFIQSGTQQLRSDQMRQEKI